MDGDAKYLVVYHEDHGGEPIALIRTDLPGNHATEIVRALKMAGGRIEVGGASSASFRKSADVATLFDAGAAPAEPGDAAPEPGEPGSTADPDAQMRAEIRTQLEMDARRQRIESEVRAEMDDERKAEEAPSASEHIAKAEPKADAHAAKAPERR
jgi:hypothetical protein